MKLCISEKSVLVLFCLFESGKEWGRSKVTSEKNIFATEGRKIASLLFLGNWGFYQVLQKKTKTKNQQRSPYSTFLPSPPCAQTHPLFLPPQSPGCKSWHYWRSPGLGNWLLSTGTNATANKPHSSLNTVLLYSSPSTPGQHISGLLWSPVTSANDWRRKETRGSLIF